MILINKPSDAEDPRDRISKIQGNGAELFEDFKTLGYSLRTLEENDPFTYKLLMIAFEEGKKNRKEEGVKERECSKDQQLRA